MGEIANSMVNGKLCSRCGVYLEPNEAVYTVPDGSGINEEVNMPSDGSAFGIPVICEDCNDDNNKYIDYGIFN